MTRKKVCVKFMSNNAARKATFKKRKQGVLKKIGELTTLCDIDACAIVFSPYEAQPEIWPNPAEAQAIITQFRSLPESEQIKRAITQTNYIQMNLHAENETRRRLEQEYRQKVLAESVEYLLSFQGDVSGMAAREFSDMAWIVDQNLKKIQGWAEAIKQQPQPPQQHDQVV